MDKIEQLKVLTIDVKTCKRCPLYYTRDQPSVSRGDPRSPLMIVSDMPRQADHKSGEILSGKPGKKIDDLLEEAGLKPEQVYFTALMKCYPGKKGYFPEDDSPSKCFGFLKQQFEIVKPMMVILAGPEALAWVLLRGTGQKPDPIDPYVGSMYRRREVYDDLRFMVIHHPTVNCKVRSKELDAKTVQVFKDAKDFIVAHQNGKMTPHLFPIDIKKPVIHSRKEQIEPYKVKKPDPVPDPPKS